MMNFELRARMIPMAIVAVLMMACTAAKDKGTQLPLMHVEGTEVVSETGDTLYIQGVNLGNWLNPEGYMFLFTGVNSPRMINELFCEAVGPEATDEFWERFKDNYITEADIRFIAEMGANTIRIPFHYALLTDRDFMGRTTREGFGRIDSCIAWCRRAGIYAVLDMHDCPGGQTGDNIDDSYGYPFLYTSPRAQDEFCSLWREIAEHYRDENTVLGYELMNEPIAHYFTEGNDSINRYLEPLYKRCVDSVRSVDRRHIILLGGAQWNGNFRVFTGAVDDPNILYACHRYGHPADESGIRDFIAFRDSTGIAMCMTETGHQPNEWLRAEAATLRRNRIGLLWWPYKKMGHGAWTAAGVPEGWEAMRQMAEADRSTYYAQRQIKVDRVAMRRAMMALTDSVRFEHIHPDTVYARIFIQGTGNR